RQSRSLVVPCANLGEARLAAPGECFGAASLLAVCGQFGSRARLRRPADEPGVGEAPIAALSANAALHLIDVRGQAASKRALLIAAAGGHSLLLMGPPGTGKSMLAQRLPGLLPPLDAEEALDVASIASVSGRGFEPRDYGRRPFRAPHHSASMSAIIGGG